MEEGPAVNSIRETEALSTLLFSLLILDIDPEKPDVTTVRYRTRPHARAIIINTVEKIIARSPPVLFKENLSINNHPFWRCPPFSILLLLRKS
jgi:hypothetical protein